MSTIALVVFGAWAQQGCDDVIDATRLRILPSYSSYGLPEGDRTAYPAAEVIVTCRIGDFGRFGDCLSDLPDPRVAWLTHLLGTWEVREATFEGCQLPGRQVRFRVSFLADDGGVKFRKGARWEAPLNP